MGKTGRPQDSHALGRQGPRPQKAASLAIPVVAGMMALLVIGGAILSLESERRANPSLPGGISMPGGTAQALPTNPPPYPDVPRISLQEAWERLQRGTAVLVDVRSRASYDKLHAAGAISVPEDEAKARLGDLPQDKEWILYCT